MASVDNTDLLIIGAGPFGLSLAAYAAHLGIEHAIVGEPMAFWKATCQPACTCGRRVIGITTR